MSEQPAAPQRSFGPVADAYDRARPSYPEQAVAWMTGPGRSAVLELGAGTGKLTEVLHRAGHEVLATDPVPAMIERLGIRVPVARVVAEAEHIPLRSRSVDLVVCGQSFHWFDHDRALLEMARVLRPGGVVALVWNTFDDAIPWVRRLKKLLAPPTDGQDSATPLMETPYFGFVEQKQFRFWQPHTARTLADLTRSVSTVSMMSENARADVLARVDALYAEYGRGHDGMQVPYITRCYRAVVRHSELPAEPVHPAPGERAGERVDGAEVDPPGLTDLRSGDASARPAGAARRPPDDPGTQLIDFT